MGIHLTDLGIIRELLLPDQSPKFSSEELEYSKIASEWLNSEAGYLFSRSIELGFVTITYTIAWET